MDGVLDIKDRSIKYRGPGCGYRHDVKHVDLDYAVTQALLDRLYIDYAPTARDRYMNMAGAAYWASIADTITTQRRGNGVQRSTSTKQSV